MQFGVELAVVAVSLAAESGPVGEAGAVAHGSVRWALEQNRILVACFRPVQADPPRTHPRRWRQGAFGIQRLPMVAEATGRI
jgi:hypothetical protein